VKRLETLDRRTCKTVSDTGIGSTSASHAPSHITTLYIQPLADKEEAFAKWYEADFVTAMKRIHGWRRTARHEVVDSLVMSANKQPQSNTAAKYIIVNGGSKLIVV
jgi:hypothetical protein